MKKLFALVFLTYLCCPGATGQLQRSTVWLTDKHNSPYSLSDPLRFLSAKSVDRRVSQQLVIDSSDLPVNPAYIEQLQKIPGVVVVNSSRWLNLVLIEWNDSFQMKQVNQLSFVRSIDHVVMNVRNQLSPIRSGAIASHGSGDITLDKHVAPTMSYPGISRSATADTINYGNNAAQVKIHHGDYLHNLGYRGKGVLIAVLDAGFSGYLTNPVFDSMRANGRVVSEYDFVKNETSVNEDHAHGTQCLSTMAANRPGVMVGTAPDASYLLLRTEDVATEKPVEEVYWLFAAEYADSAGADLISSSLGYTTFDNPVYNYLHENRDGNTAIITKAADLAASKGMLVINSAGNSGTASDHRKYIMCPADGDSVITVGAVNSKGEIAHFSCRGPNGAGKRKPNIVSVGWAAVYANGSGNTSVNNGTSFSAPNVAGLIACLWQAFPDFTSSEIKQAVERSANKYDTPDEEYGFGIPDFRKAHNYLASRREQKLASKLKRSWLTAYPVPFHQEFTVFFKAQRTGKLTLRLFDNNGRLLQLKNIPITVDQYYTVPMTTPFRSAGMYYLQYDDGTSRDVLTVTGK